MHYVIVVVIGQPSNGHYKRKYMIVFVQKWCIFIREFESIPTQYNDIVKSFSVMNVL